ncbi:helix-turn-helix domain-containing protein [Priestia abyssalis]|uniref:helix-turn-helix domain-containing protein n=1 Tax=Priestia abyssalis TaxID=1221450 RepID=UPI002E273121
MLSLTELGKRLREAREQQNMSLEDLQKLTKIQKRYLVGIEEGNYDLMPGKFYVRAFIKQYCEAVGLNPEEIFEEYKSDIPVTQTEELPEQLSRVRTRKETPVQDSKVFDALPKILLTIGAIGIAVLIWVFAQNREMAKEEVSPETTAEVEQSKETPVPEEPVKDEEEKTNEPQNEEEDIEKQAGTEDLTEGTNIQKIVELQKSGKSAVLQLQNADEFQVEISSKGETWVGVKNGKGNSFYQGMLKSGEAKTFDFTKETEVRFNIGNTLDTEVKINGQTVPFPSNPSDQVQQIITIQYSPSDAVEASE